jgi:hypothetical protein
MVTDMNEMVRTKTSAKDGFGAIFLFAATWLVDLPCALEHRFSHTQTWLFVGYCQCCYEFFFFFFLCVSPSSSFSMPKLSIKVALPTGM